MKKTTIFIVDDHQIVREGLKNMLSIFPEFQITGEAEDGLSALHSLRILGADLVILDIEMPKMDGLKTARLIVDKFPDTKIIMMSAIKDRDVIGESFKIGAHGYINKDCGFDDLVKAINRVISGNLYLNADGEKSNQFISEIKNNPDPYLKLTAREKTIIKLLANSFSSREISSELGISIKTVESHRRNISSKLNNDSVAYLAKLAKKRNLI